MIQKPFLSNLDKGQPAYITGKCDLCEIWDPLVWDGNTYVCPDMTACYQRGQIILKEIERQQKEQAS